jgi:type 2 lantibiotic biosynthesis protein LanM
LYALEAADFHCENLIAAGENPMPIDLEALFHPRFPEDGGHDCLADSVLKAGLLPTRFAGVDMSGLGSAAGQIVPDGVPRWQNAETDEMRLVQESMTTPGAQNRPQYAGAEVDAPKYTAEIADGFERTYRLLLRHRDEAPGVVRRFANDEVRIIARPTRTYALLLWESFHPDFLRDSSERGRLFERLRGMDAFRPAEKLDLMRGDVPLFLAKPGYCDVWTSHGERIANFFPESGMNLVTQRIAALSEKDLESQLWIIRASMATLSSPDEGPAKTRARLRTGRDVEPAELLSEAGRIGNRLAELALGREDTIWIGLTLDDDQNMKLGGLEADLYDGLPGVILFLAYLGEITGESRHTELAKAGLRTLQKLLRAQPGMDLPCGLVGRGGLIYCFAQLGALWNDEGLRCHAAEMAEQAATRAVSDVYLDVTSGVAGLALALRSVSGADTVARICGERLLASTTTTAQGIGWQRDTLSKQPLTGFAHGNAGIGYALFEIAAMTGEPRFAAVGFQAFQYERELFSKERCNWPDLRENKTDDYMLAWCHGAPGVGLSRLGVWRYGEDELLRKEIDAALETTVREGFGRNQSLCHGDFGNLDLLAVASEVLGDTAWERRANRLAGGIIDRAKGTGWICGNAAGMESPGLMTGIAGIGYELLRLAVPERVPSVLALEKPRCQ